MKKVCLVAALVLAVALAQTAFAQGTIKLGINEMRSGAFKTNGDRVVWGVEAAVKEINEAGGLLGKKVEVVVEDNQGKPEIGVQNVKKLLLDQGCEIIIQGSSSAVAGAIGQTMPRYKKIYLCTNGEAMAVTGENFNPYVFRTCMNAATHIKGLAKYFSGKGLKKVFLINQDYSWGKDVSTYYEKLVKQFAPDAQIVGNEFHPVFTKDFAPYITKIKASGADYIITGNWGTDLTQLIIQARDLGVKIPFGTTFIDDDGVMNVAREKGLGDVGANMYVLGVDNPKAKAFEDTFHKSSDGKWPSFVAMEAYIGVKMYAEAVKKAGSVDTEKVIKAFEGLVWDGPAGKHTIRKEDHQDITPSVVGVIVEKTKYYDFPYLKPVAIYPPEEMSITLEEAGWKPWKP